VIQKQKVLNKLTSNWFYNLKNGKINDEILYIHISQTDKFVFDIIVDYINSIVLINQNNLFHSIGQYWKIGGNYIIKTKECIYRFTWTPKTETLGHLDKNI
jgi:hypothetical protein